MTNPFLARVREAINHRRQMQLPNVAFLIATVMGLTLVYIVFATGFIEFGDLDAYEFRSERGIITVLSGYYLIASACFSLAAFIVLVRAQEGSRWLWLALAIGFTFLANKPGTFFLCLSSRQQRPRTPAAAA